MLVAEVVSQHLDRVRLEFLGIEFDVRYVGVVSP